MKNGIIIPCYNEASRLQLDKYQDFLNRTEDYTLCFVNDGSTDCTLTLLQAFQRGQDDRVVIYDLEANQGKAEAVRSGMLHMSLEKEIETVGFIDADLSTDFNDYTMLVEQLNASTKDIVFGSRKMNPSTVERGVFRKFASYLIGALIRFILKLPIRDTQCGAKVMPKHIARWTFDQPFITKWLFDVEMFIRLRIRRGSSVMDSIQEVPLTRWVHEEGSKLTLKDSLEIPAQLVKIWKSYDLKPRLEQMETNLRTLAQMALKRAGMF